MNKSLLFLALLLPALLVTLLSFATLLFSTADVRQAMPKMRPLHSFKPSFQERPEPTITPSPPSPPSTEEANKAAPVTSPGESPVQYLPESVNHALFVQPVITADGGGLETAATSVDSNQPDSAVVAQPTQPTASGDNAPLANPNLTPTSTAEQIGDDGNNDHHGNANGGENDNDNDQEHENNDDNDNDNDNNEDG